MHSLAFLCIFLYQDVAIDQTWRGVTFLTFRERDVKALRLHGSVEKESKITI